VDYSSLSAVDLVRSCTKSDNPDAWEEFVRRFHRLIASVVMRTARRWGVTSATVFDDAVQEIYLKLCRDDCRLLREFKPSRPDAIFGYLKVVTANATTDYIKSIRRQPDEPCEEPDDVEALDSGRGPGSPAVTERQILINEIDACLRRILPAATREIECRIFWLHYRAGMSARAISELPFVNLTTKGVESMLLRLVRLLREELAEKKVF
jgi:RNA polymerase sigma-70 factor (ECF subfamily)